MAHFAEVDATNIVVRVLVVADDQEHRGQDFLANDLGLGGTWIQTSYRTSGGEHPGGTPLRGNYAGVGHTYDPSEDVFYGPQPYSSWVLNDGYQWEAPTPNTNSGYIWDEDTTSWIKPDSPYPSWVWDDGRWQPPASYPGTIGEEPVYDWDEDTTSWVEVE